MADDAGGINHVVLTGATGFIGRALQRGLLREGFELRALVRPQSPNRRLILDGIEVSVTSLADTAGVEAALDQADAVIYCAGAVRGRDYGDFVAANVDGVKVVAGILARRVPTPLLLISSLAASRPQLSHYARSKCEGERTVQNGGVGSWCVLRPPAVYGPGDKEMLPLFRAIRFGLAWRTGPRSQRLSLLHVEDLAGAVAAWLRNPAACNGRIFAIDDGHEQGYGWDEIIDASKGALPVVKIPLPTMVLDTAARLNSTASRLLNYAPMLTPGKVRELSEPAWLCDNAPFAAATGWRPSIHLREGVESLFGARSRGRS